MHLPNEDKLNFIFNSKLKTISFIFLGLGILSIVLQIIFPWHSHSETHGNPRLFYSLYLGFLVFLPIAIGSLFFVAVHHLSGAAWSVTYRRLAESHFWFMPVIVIIFLILMLTGIDTIFHHWTHAKETDELIKHKSGWLNKPFFLTRNVIIFFIWTLFGWFFWKYSTQQDIDGKFEHTPNLAKISAVFAVIFGITISTTSWDLSMSLEPHWFSTIWAIYIFAGVLLSSFSVLAIWSYFLKKAGYYENTLTEDHLHDIGKYLWGSSIFWAYIGIASQFLLIWYAHIPEETIFFNYRLYNENFSHTPWALVSLVLVFNRFLVPFFLLIKRESKRNFQWMAFSSLVILLGQVVDMYWVLYPTLDHGNFVMISWQELGSLFFYSGLYILVISYGLSKVKIIPIKDPRLEECLHSHH
ncbi:MAG: hypothetical protein ACK4UJ_06715 [Leptonema sp. (in: bacteria)]